MTKEDAIFFLNQFRTPWLNEHLYEAIGVAIEALRGPVRCGKCKHSEEAFLPYRELWCNAHEIHCTSDWFCADGERKEG